MDNTSRSIADKLDLGAGMRVPTKEELAKVQTFISAKGITPNLFIDIYKNRRSKYKSVRLWLHADLSCMRYTGLFVTDWKHNLVEINETHIPLGMDEKYGEISI